MANEGKIYECEVKKLFMRDGVKCWGWLRMSVLDAEVRERKGMVGVAKVPPRIV